MLHSYVTYLVEFKLFSVISYSVDETFVLFLKKLKIFDAPAISGKKIQTKQKIGKSFSKQTKTDEKKCCVFK